MTLLLFLSSFSEEKKNSVFAHSHVLPLVYVSLEQEARWEGFGVYTMRLAGCIEMRLDVEGQDSVWLHTPQVLPRPAFVSTAAHLFTRLSESFVCIWFVMQGAEQRCDTIKTVVAVRQGGH